MTSPSSRRVVITGMGLISPLGNTLESLWEALISRRSGVGPLTSVPADHLPAKFAGEARDFTGHINDFGPLEANLLKNIRKGLKVMCREIQMGVAAAQRAMSHARLVPGVYDPDRTGVVYGADYMMTLPEEFLDGVKMCLDAERRFEFHRWADEGLPKVTPLWLLKYLPNMPASHIAIYNDLRGPNNSLTIREASANLALGEAYCTIVRGSADIIVCGATGTRVHPMRTVHVVLQEELADGTSDAARLAKPFDLHRTGMVLGEGAGAVVMEELEAAKKRGADILAEVVGYGSSSVIEPSGAANCTAAVRNVLLQALRTAGMKPEELGHLHAHGLGTRKADADEARAIRDLFSNSSRPVPVTAAKSYFGNLGAGSGAVELISSILALDRGQLFPILNYESPDPACPIHVATSLDADPGNSALNVNFTPQGQASALLVRKFS